MAEPIENKYELLSELIQQMLTGEIAEDAFERLCRMLSEDPKSLRYYIEYATIWALLDETEGLTQSTAAPGFDTSILEALAQEERTAATITVPKPETAPELIQKVQREKIEYRFSRGSLVSIIVSLAAALVIVLFLRFGASPSGQKVAVLSDSMGAKWGHADRALKTGDSVITSLDSLWLQEGYAEFQFDNNARVVVEGPAVFQVLTEDTLHLDSGRLYAYVSPEALGFTVTTQTAKVIDLGTEFGVQADGAGDTLLHVVRGKTALIAGGKSGKSKVEVTEGQAKKVSAVTLAVSDIPCDTELFVRAINSEHHIAWRGQKEINLADIVGGGTGFGSGDIGKGINPADGGAQFTFTGQGHPGKPGYMPVPGFDFIDGVFVPNAHNGAVPITSQGHVFMECPETTEKYFDMIRNGGVIKTAHLQERPMDLSGRVYGTRENPALYLHSNAGITFDLEAIRQALPGCTPAAFRSFCGISPNPEAAGTPRADIFVLVDGRLKKNASLTSNPGTSVDLDIPLLPADRFLTLVTTDAGGIGSDWVLFTHPYLVLKPIE